MNTKIFIVAFFCVLAIKGAGQFTLLAATHSPTVGTVSYSSYNPILSPLPDQDGPNCLWNFSGITLNKKNYDVRTYVPPSAGGLFLFPSVTLERDFGGNFGQTEYYKSTNSAFEVLGYSDDTEPLIYNDPHMIYKWPMTYGDTFSDIYVATVLPVTPVWIDSGKVFTSITGFGTLTLPNGVSYSNVLKMHKMHSSVQTWYNLFDTLITKRKMIQDIYFNASTRYPVMEVRKWSIDTIFDILVLEPSTVGIEEQESPHQLSILPNPANGKINLRFTNQSSNECVAFLYSSEGREVKKILLGNTPGINKDIEIHDLPSGIYLLKVLSGSNTSEKKFVVD